MTSATVSVSEVTNDDDQDDDSSFFSDIANIIYVAGGAIVACALVGCFLFGVKQMTSRRSGQSLSNDGVEMMAGYGGHQSPPQAVRAAQEYEVQAVRTAMEESLRTGTAGTHGHGGHGPSGPPPGFAGHGHSHAHGRSHAHGHSRGHGPPGPPPNMHNHDEEAVAAAIQRSMEETSAAAFANQVLPPAKPPKPSKPSYLAPPSPTYDPNGETEVTPTIDGSNDVDDAEMAAAIKRSMEET